MPIFRGTNNISKIFRGNTEIVKAFRGTDLIFTSALPFGAYELIADVNVTANTTQIDFDNLNITKDDELRLVYTFVGDSSTSNSLYSIRYNNVSSNYTRQSMESSFDGSLINASRGTNSFISFGRSTRKSSGFSDIKVSNNDRFVSQSNNSFFIGAESSNIIQTHGNIINTSTVSSITKLSVVSNRTNGIAVGSRLQLYKVVT